jgi:cystathionine beta-lyase
MTARAPMSPAADSSFDLPLDRLAVPSAKWAKYRGRDILPMWIADMDFRVAPPVAAALADFAARGDFGYARTPDDLPENLVGYCQRMYGWSFDPAAVLWLPAMVPGIQLAVRACCAEGEAAVAFSPIYPPFLHAAGLQGRTGITLPLLERRDGLRLDHEIDFDRLEAVLKSPSPRVRLLLLCHPHNPIGRLWRRDELERLATLTLRHDLLVLSDEVHADLILDGRTRHSPFALLSPEIARRTITINGPGKAYNTAGLGIGWAVVEDAALRSRFRKAMARLVPEPCAPAWGVLRATLNDCEPWRQQALAYLSINRDRVVDALAAAGLPHTRPVVSYLSWFDARPIGLPADELAAHLERHGLGLSDGRDFGLGGLEGYFRLNFALPRSQLDEGLARLARAAAHRP